MPPAVPALEIGGTHVTAALVDPAGWTIAGTTVRAEIDAEAAAHDLLDRFAGAASALSALPGAPWAVAMPDPFDYRLGIGRFHGVGKFASLDGIDVRAELWRRLPAEPGGIVFCNDADAFTVGEWVSGRHVLPPGGGSDARHRRGQRLGG